MNCANLRIPAPPGTPAAKMFVHVSVIENSVVPLYQFRRMRVSCSKELSEGGYSADAASLRITKRKRDSNFSIATQLLDIYTLSMTSKEVLA